jgi:hypothetical protein
MTTLSAVAVADVSGKGRRNSNGTNDREVHDLFVITGRSDAAGCDIAQPNFLPAGNPPCAFGKGPRQIPRALPRRYSDTIRRIELSVAGATDSQLTEIVSSIIILLQIVVIYVCHPDISVWINGDG